MDFRYDWENVAGFVLPKDLLTGVEIVAVKLARLEAIDVPVEKVVVVLSIDVRYYHLDVFVDELISGVPKQYREQEVGFNDLPLFVLLPCDVDERQRLALAFHVIALLEILITNELLQQLVRTC